MAKTEVVHGSHARCNVEIRRLRDEIKRLQAIVDKLPKCWRLNGAGELVQDVPITPDMQLWQIDTKHKMTNGGKPWPCGPGWSFQRWSNHPVYSTPEAAEAAKGE